MNISLNEKVALVTGAGSGIGQSTALQLADAGAHICIVDVNFAAAKHTQSLINAQGGNASVYQCDVSNQQQVQDVVATVLSQHSIDILVNNAGIAHVGSLQTTSEDDFDKIYQINVKGTYNCMFAVIDHMKTKQSGVIINLASVASTVGIADRFAYSMSKGAVLTMTYSVAKDYINDGIRCNCIAPARVHTPFVDNFIEKNYPDKKAKMFEKLSKSQPIGRMGKVDEVASLIVYLCSDAAAFITGTNVPIDGGFVSLNN